MTKMARATIDGLSLLPLFGPAGGIACACIFVGGIRVDVCRASVGSSHGRSAMERWMRMCVSHMSCRANGTISTLCVRRGIAYANACAPVGSLAAGLTRSVVDEGQEYLECAVDADIFPSKYCTLTSQYP